MLKVSELDRSLTHQNNKTNGNSLKVKFTFKREQYQVYLSIAER